MRLLDDAVVATDLNQVVLFWNPAAEKLYEIPFSEAIGRPIQKVIEFKLKSPITRAEIRNIIHDEGHFRSEAIHISKNEKRIWVDWSIKPLEIPDRGICGVLETAKEITLRKRAETALRESEARFRELVENMSSGVAVYQAIGDGEDFIIRDFNRSAVKLTQTERDRAIGSKVTDAFPGVKEFGLFNVFQRVWRTGIGEHFPSTLYQDKRLSVWFENYVYRLPSGEIVAVFDDQTDQKKAELALLDSEEKFRIIGESARDAIVMVDSTGCICFWSQAGERILGYSEREVLGKDAGIFIVTSKLGNSPNHAVETIDSTGKVRSIGKTLELVLRHKDGSTVPVELSISEVSIKQQWHAIWIMRDISERIQAESERVKLEGQLRQSQKMEAIGRLAGGVAHDFNNVLTGITGYSEIVQNSLGKLDPLYSYVEEIRKASERAAALTHQLLAFSRKQIIEPRVIQVKEVLEGSKRMLERIIGEDIDLSFSFPEDLWCIFADPTQIDQILVNLVVNARDAMPNGGKLCVELSNTAFQIPSKTSKEISELNDYVMIAVTDSGVGIDQNIQQHIFEPFFTTKEKGYGSGLGLSIVYGIVQQNNGFITVYSEKGYGTSLKIYLPAEKEEPRAQTRPQAEELPVGSETIMLVEDEEMVRKLAMMILEGQGYKVIAAENGGHAMLLAESYQEVIHLLLSDVVMPVLNGKELHEKLKIRRPHLKALFMSGYTEDVIAHRGILDRGICFIQKPFTLEALARKIREVLDGH